MGTLNKILKYPPVFRHYLQLPANVLEPHLFSPETCLALEPYPRTRQANRLSTTAVPAKTNFDCSTFAFERRFVPQQSAFPDVGVRFADAIEMRIHVDSITT